MLCLYRPTHNPQKTSGGTSGNPGPKINFLKQVRKGILKCAGKAVVLGLPCYNILAAMVIILAGLTSELGGPMWWSAGLGDAVLGVLFIRAILQETTPS